ncbi:hypothetical protein JX266_007663 [Neoarthrinium moseri]|nr:hypothetical protein JX266_007663 [Neoarthrinium moseri]
MQSQAPSPRLKTGNNLVVLATSNYSSAKHLIRVLVDNMVKYIIVPDEVPDGWQFRANGSLSSLPPIPRGNGKYYRLERTGETTCPFFPRTTNVPEEIDSITDPNVHHDIQINYAEFQKVPSRIQKWSDSHNKHFTERTTAVTHPSFKNDMVMRIVEFPESLWKPEVNSPGGRRLTLTERMTTEFLIQQRAASRGLAPEITGLVTEAGRGIIGFLSEFVHDGKSVSDYWTSRGKQELDDQDIEACLQLAKGLARLNIYHGDLTPSNLIRRDDGTVLAIDFEFATDSSSLKDGSARQEDEFNDLRLMLIRNTLASGDSSSDEALQ